MHTAVFTGRVGASAVSPGSGNVRRAAMRMTMSVIVVAVLVTVMAARASVVSPAVRLSADSTALILGGTTVPTPRRRRSSSPKMAVARTFFTSPRPMAVGG